MQPGQRVLIHAAAGGVGHFAVQIAKHLGAHVIGTARSARHDWLTGLGADQLIDYTTVAFDDVLVDVDVDVDVVLDLAGDARGNTGTRSLSVLRPGGLIIAVPGGVSPELAAAADAAGVRATPFLVEPNGTALTLASPPNGATPCSARSAATRPSPDAATNGCVTWRTSSSPISSPRA